MYYVLSVEFFHISTSIYIFLFDEKSYIIAQLSWTGNDTGTPFIVLEMRTHALYTYRPETEIILWIIAYF